VNILDEEVFAVILAVVVVGSVFAAAYTMRLQLYAVYEGSSIRGIRAVESIGEPFTAIGLLNEECKIGSYPAIVFLGENLALCIYVANYLGYPALLRVEYKLAYNTSQLPTNTSPSLLTALKNFTFLLPDRGEAVRPVKIPIEADPAYIGRNVTLVFELWQYDPEKGWIYTGRWVHLHVRLEAIPHG